MSDQLREYAKAIAGATKVIDKDGLVSYARDTTRFGAGLKESYELAVAYLAEHPEPQPITADWLREQGWEWDDQSQFFFFEAPNLFVVMEERDGTGKGWTFQLDDWSREVTDTADLSNLVAAIRGGNQ